MIFLIFKFLLTILKKLNSIFAFQILKMSKNTIATFFIVIFMGFIMAPSIITILDDAVDISIFYSLAEEEEKGSEKDKNIEILFSSANLFESDLCLDESENNLAYFFKTYAKPHLNLISPPPDLS